MIMNLRHRDLIRCGRTTFSRRLGRRIHTTRPTRTRRLPIRTRRGRHSATTYLRICHEGTQSALEEHCSHWGRSQNQRRQDQAHAALLQRHAAHALGQVRPQQCTQRRRASERSRHARHHFHGTAGHRSQHRHREQGADAKEQPSLDRDFVCSNSRQRMNSGPKPMSNDIAIWYSNSMRLLYRPVHPSPADDLSATRADLVRVHLQQLPPAHRSVCELIVAEAQPSNHPHTSLSLPRSTRSDTSDVESRGPQNRSNSTVSVSPEDGFRAVSVKDLAGPSFVICAALLRLLLRQLKCWSSSYARSSPPRLSTWHHPRGTLIEVGKHHLTVLCTRRGTFAKRLSFRATFLSLTSGYASIGSALGGGNRSPSGDPLTGRLRR